MKKRKALSLIGVFYFTSIILFGLIYFILSIRDPSNFIINSEYNEHTISPYSKYNDLDTLEKKTRFITAKKTNELIAPYYDSISSVEENNDSLNQHISEVNKLDSLIQIEQNKFLTKKINTEIKNSTKIFNDQIDSLTLVLRNELIHQQNTDNNSQNYFDNQVNIAKLKYKIAKLELALNKQKLKVYNIDFANYFSDSLKKTGLECSHRIDSLENKLHNNLERITHLSEQIRMNVIDYYTGQREKVHFFDFIYFSIVTATSTGYGDIVPNSTSVRILASIEIIASISLFGFFFYYIAKPNETKKEE